MNRLYRTRWFMPAFYLLVPALIFAAFAIGGNTGDGAVSAAVLLVLGAVFFFGGRHSETLAGLGGPGPDERWGRNDMHPTPLAGVVVVLRLIGAWLGEIAHGHPGQPLRPL